MHSMTFSREPKVSASCCGLRVRKVIAMLKSIAVLLLFAGAAFAEGPAPKAADTATVAVKDDGRPVFEYCHGGDLFKPYVAKLFSPGGVNVLRDQIADHPHHHGLMFAVGVDGVDFWAEDTKCGREVTKSFETAEYVPGDKAWLVTLESGIVWFGPQFGVPLAMEDRKVTTYLRREMGATLLTWQTKLLTWQTKLRPAEGKPSIKLTGSHYFGLGMRFVQSMDGADDFFTPEGKAAGETVRGNERLVRGKWCAYAAEVDGKPVTVAMFDHPENVRPAWWFIMAKPFAYMSATLNLHREPLEIEAGKPLKLAYGVAVWDGKVNPEQIEKLYKRWLELVGPINWVEREFYDRARRF